MGKTKKAAVTKPAPQPTYGVVLVGGDDSAACLVLEGVVPRWTAGISGASVAAYARLGMMSPQHRLYNQRGTDCALDLTVAEARKLIVVLQNFVDTAKNVGACVVQPLVEPAIEEADEEEEDGAP